MTRTIRITLPNQLHVCSAVAVFCCLCVVASSARAQDSENSTRPAPETPKVAVAVSEKAPERPAQKVVPDTSITGHYLETRTCQVYTGPCFANGETGLTGREALMAWNIQEGSFAGEDLEGFSVVVAVQGTETLGHAGLKNAQSLRSVIFVDDRASKRQQQALAEFATSRIQHDAHTVVRVSAAPIQMSLDEIRLQGRLNVGREVELVTRKAGLGDCICSNETAFYPPLVALEHFAPGVTTVGEFHGRGLGVRWSTPESRSAYMATFTY